MFLVEEPGGRFRSIVETIAARKKSQTGGDYVDIRLKESRPLLKRIRFEESIHQPEPVWSEDWVKLIQIFRFSILWNAVKTAKIKGKVKRFTNPLQVGSVLDQ